MPATPPPHHDWRVCMRLRMTRAANAEDGLPSFRRRDASLTVGVEVGPPGPFFLRQGVSPWGKTRAALSPH